jgi:hypothetical protein
MVWKKIFLIRIPHYKSKGKKKIFIHKLFLGVQKSIGHKIGAKTNFEIPKLRHGTHKLYKHLKIIFPLPPFWGGFAQHGSWEKWDFEHKNQLFMSHHLFPKQRGFL